MRKKGDGKINLGLLKVLRIFERSKHTSEEEEAAAMFPGMFMEKPDKALALKQLRTHVALFGGWVVVVRAVPYVLSYFSDSKEELRIDF